MQGYQGGRAILNGLPPVVSQTNRWQIPRALGMAFVLVLALTAILVVPSSRQVQFKEGDVSPVDIRAPRKIEFESAVSTEQARAAAIAAAPDIYSPVDLRITRQAVKRASEVLETIEWVRGATNARPDEKVSMLRGVSELHDLPSVIADQSLAASPESWRRIANETLRVVEVVMRQPIRETELGDVRRRLPSYVSLALTDAETAAVVEYANRFIRPTSLLDQAATDAARRQAAAAIPPTIRTIERGEIIVRAGDIIQPRHIEALERLNLLNDTMDWRGVLGTALLVGLLVFILELYVAYRNPDFWVDWRRGLLWSLIIVGFALLAKFMVPGRTLLPYIFPGAAAAMLLTVLLEPRFALSATLLIGLMASLLAGQSVPIFVYVLLSGVVASLALWRIERLSGFAWAGVYVTLMNVSVLAAFRLIRGDNDLQGWVELALAALGSGILATSLTAAGYYILGNMFDLTTSLRLMELARPDQPLLRQLQLKAPGTYHHSLVVSNMAEEAAHRIGADALLARVAAYYHDVGKLKNPAMFIENQLDGRNPHDWMDAEDSAQTIIAHVANGTELAAEAQLPRTMIEMISQHHGTTLVKYFFNRALERSLPGEDIDESRFRYPGPRPNTREAGLLMLADCSEAAVRAKKPQSPEEIHRIIAQVVTARLNEGQLDDCPLTLRDVERAREGFESVLQGVYHPRIDYPTTVEPTEPALERLGQL